MFKKPFSFEGRITREEYGISMALYVICLPIAMFMARGGRIGALASFTLLVFAIIFILAQGTKRCHDIGRSGWWQLIPFYAFYLLYAEGDIKSNEYDIRIDASNTDRKEKPTVLRDTNAPDGPPQA